MESEDGITSITDFYTDCADAELFQNGRDAGVFAVGSDGSDPPAGKRTWEKAVRQDRKKVVLTPQGEEFLEHANRILYDVHQAKASMNDTDELKNPLHIGTIESLCTVKFPKIIRKFREQYPRVSIRITVDSPEKLIQMMEHNELDMIYILDTPRWDSNWIKVMEKAEPVMFVTSVSHRLAKERNLLLDDLLKESFYLTERNANYRQALDGQLALRRKELSPMLEISDTAFIKKMLMRGGGVSFLPRFAVEDDIEKKKLTLLDVKDIEITMYRQISIIKISYKTKEMEEICRVALEDN
mgnify:CR=1 FL=1